MFNPVSALGNALSNAVESTLDAVLPKQLEFVGDLASLAIDLRSGNVLKALDDLHDLFKDLPQQLAELTKKENQRTGEAEDDCVDSAAFEPTPPPPYEAEPGPLETAERPRDSGSQSGGASRAPESGARPGFGGPPHSPAAPVMRGAPPVAEEMEGGTAGTGGTRATAKAATEETAKTTAAKKSAPSEKTAGQSKSAGAAKGSGAADVKEAKEPAETKEAANAFFKQSDEALMADLRKGDLPKAVSESPAQMQRLQLRMQEITQMNQLITTMLTAMHEMNKQVIQNLRV